MTASVSYCHIPGHFFAVFVMWMRSIVVSCDMNLLCCFGKPCHMGVGSERGQMLFRTTSTLAKLMLSYFIVCDLLD